MDRAGALLITAYRSSDLVAEPIAARSKADGGHEGGGGAARPPLPRDA